jgi:hypothetical protein
MTESQAFLPEVSLRDPRDRNASHTSAFIWNALPVISIKEKPITIALNQVVKNLSEGSMPLPDRFAKQVRKEAQGNRV